MTTITTYPETDTTDPAAVRHETAGTSSAGYGPALAIRPLSGAIGAEIRGVDLKRPLPPETYAEIRAAWLRYKVVFFPGQHLSPEQHRAFAAQFGELTPAHPVIPGIDGYPEVFEIDYGRARELYASYGDLTRRRTSAVGWHTDVTFVTRPPAGSVLNAVVIPPSGGDTLWTNQVAAFEALSPAFQEFLSTLTAVHDGGAQFSELLRQRNDNADADTGGAEWDGEAYAALTPVEHPVVRTHPETGERSLFVNAGFTSHIAGLEPAESQALLAFLYQHSTSHEFIVRYHWTAGDLGFWDNRATQHSVVGDFGDQARVIQRVTIRGDVPV
jgi:alpha-ketoglutarate-dependent taurine dioxygenase